MQLMMEILMYFLNNLPFEYSEPWVRGTDDAGFYTVMHLMRASETECYMHIDLCLLAQDLVGNCLWLCRCHSGRVPVIEGFLSWG